MYRANRFVAASRLVYSVCVILACCVYCETAVSQSKVAADSPNDPPAMELPDSIQEKLQNSIQAVDRSQDSELETKQEDQEQRIRSIQERIQLLNKIIREQSQQAAKSPLTTTTPKTPDGIATDPPGLQNQSVAIEPPLPKALQNANIVQPPAENPQEFVFPAEMSAPVNPVELANSLFLMGNLDDAFSKYEYYMEQDSLSAAADSWAKCAMAGCLRQRREFSKAESYYRDVVTAKDDSFPVKISRWYLEHLAKRKQVESELMELSKVIESINAKQGKTK